MHVFDIQPQASQSKSVWAQQTIKILPSPSVLLEIGRYIGWYIGRYSTDTQPVDKCFSIGRHIYQ